MKVRLKIKVFLVFFITAFFVIHNAFATVKTSAASGLWTTAGTWSPSGVPANTDTVIIATTYTVTLNAPKTVVRLEIQSGATLTNSGATGKITINTPGIISYVNNGTHNGSWNGSSYSGTALVFNCTSLTDVDGNGTINGSVTITSGGPNFLSTCNMRIIRANLGNTSGTFTTTGTNCIGENNGNITVNGNILLRDSGMIFTNNGTFTQGGANGTNIYDGATFKNFGIFTTVNYLNLYNQTNSNDSMGGVFENTGTAIINGNVLGVSSPTVLGYTKSIFIQNSGSYAKFGGWVFGLYNNGELALVGFGSAGPNTVEYNGNNQVVNYPLSPTYGSTSGEYYHLICSNSGTKSLDSNIIINGNLTIRGTAILDSRNYAGTTDYSVSLKGNWNDSSSAAQPFIPRDKNVTFNGVALQTIHAVTQAETFHNLTISNAANVTLSNNINISDTLNFTSGKIILGTNNLTITTPTPIMGYSSSNYVVTDNTGYLQTNGISTTPFIFPVGPGTSLYNPVSISNTTYSKYNVKVCDYVNTDGTCSGGTPIVDWGINKTWTIGLDSGSADATVELQWNSATDEMPGFQPSNCAVNRHNGANWTAYNFGFYTDKGNGYRSRAASGITAFSPFGVSGGGTPLPVELLTFTGELNPEGLVVLNWTTATETNNDYFTVERANPSVLPPPISPGGGRQSSGLIFIPIGTVKGAGNSSIPLYYHLLDNSPSPSERAGVRYYRLKQTDFDGKTAYSQIISVLLKNSNTFSTYPNPAIDNVNLNFSSEKEGLLLISVIDKLGRTLISKNENMIEGQNSITLDVSAINPGAYVLQMTTASGVKEQRALMINK